MRKIPEARVEAGRLPQDDVLRLLTESILADKAGDTVASEQFIAKMDQVSGSAAAYQDAAAYAQRPDAQRAVAALQHALSIRDPGLGWLLVDPLFDPIRRDGRFRAFLSAMDFPRA